MKCFELSAKFNDVVGQQVGLNRRYAIALDALHRVEAAQQVDETFARVISEVADVYSRDYNLLATVGGSPTSLFGKVGNPSAAAASAGTGIVQ